MFCLDENCESTDGEVSPAALQLLRYRVALHEESRLVLNLLELPLSLPMSAGRVCASVCGGAPTLSQTWSRVPDQTCPALTNHHGPAAVRRHQVTGDGMDES